MQEFFRFTHDDLEGKSPVLSERAFWDELQYRLFVRKKIEAGIADVRDGRVLDDEAIFSEWE